MRNKFLLLVSIAALSLGVWGCASNDSARSNYFGYNNEPKIVNDAGSNTSTLDQQQPKQWQNPLSDGYASSSDYTLASEGSAYPASVAVIVPWWDRYYDQYYYPSPRYYFDYNWSPFWDPFWSVGWYSPWYSYHPYYGYSWGYPYPAYYPNYYGRYYHRYGWYGGSYYSGRSSQPDPYRHVSRLGGGPGRGISGNGTYSGPPTNSNRAIPVSGNSSGTVSSGGSRGIPASGYGINRTVPVRKSTPTSNNNNNSRYIPVNNTTSPNNSPNRTIYRATPNSSTNQNRGRSYSTPNTWSSPSRGSESTPSRGAESAPVRRESSPARATPAPSNSSPERSAPSSAPVRKRDQSWKSYGSQRNNYYSHSSNRSGFSRQSAPQSFHSYGGGSYGRQSTPSAHSAPVRREGGSRRNR